MATVTGSTGDDVLVGTPADDALLGKGGADLLTGGLGADRFVLQDAASAALDSSFAATARITDFRPAEGDLLVLRGQAAGALFQPIASRSFAPPGGALRPVGFGGVLPGAAGLAAGPAAGLALPDPSDGGAWVLWWLPAPDGPAPDGAAGWLLLDADRDGTLSAGDLVVRVDLPEGGGVTAASFVPGTFALLGTGGQDAITGDGGDDSILGFAAEDRLAGGAGNDTLDGGDGGDALSGGAGFDRLRGAAGDDTLSGGTETDVLDGGDGQDRLDGGDAADLLLGGSADDLLLGGEGDDTLEGGGGGDILFGGTGADRFILHPAGPAASSSLAAMDFVVDFGAADGDRIFLGDPFGGLADGSFATAGTFTGADGVARPLLFNGSLAPRVSITAGISLPARPLGGLDAYQVWWLPAVEGVAAAGGWVVLDLDRDGWLGEADFVARFGSADAPVTIMATDFADGTFLSFGGGFVRAGTAGDDSLAGGSLGETFLGSAGHDRIAGGIGAPNGVSYAALAGPVALLATGYGAWLAMKPDGADTLGGIHAIAGTAGADTLDGSSAGDGSGASQSFFALSLEGRGGADSIIGNGTAGLQASYGGSPGAVVVDLLLGTAEDGWGSTDTLAGVHRIAATSGFADTVLGSFGDDVFLTGSAGNKTFDGRSGRDEYRYAGTGDITIVLTSTRFGSITQGPYALKPGGTDRLAGIEIAAGGGGNDSILGSAAEERLAGGMGQDTLDGGSGLDTVWYDYLSAGAALPSQGVVLNLTTGTATDPWGGTDTLRNLESAWGTQLGDDLTGRAVVGQRTWLRGLAGDDTLRAPQAGSMVGADHATDAAGIVADLAAGTVADGWGGTDTLVLIDHLRGSAFADLIAGNALGNALDGLDGDDTLVGGDGDDTLIGGFGLDVLLGGTGFDTASHETAAVGVTVSLAASAMNTGDAAGEMFSGIEDLRGSAFGDWLSGDTGANRLEGVAGDDALDGNAGGDTLDGGAGNDTLVGGAGADVLIGGAGIDTASYEAAAAGVTASFSAPGTNTGDAFGDTFSGVENLRGSAFLDRLVTTAGANRLEGLAGDDTLIGGAGADTLDAGIGNYDMVSYENAATVITASLAAPGINTGDAAGDVYLGVEGLRGSNFGDTLSGDIVANRLVGLGGDDTLSGGDHSDTLVGGVGADLLIGGNNSDRASYEAALAGVTVFLLAAARNTGEAAGDIFVGIENLRGSSFADYLTTGVGPNAVEGWAGDDTLDGGAGGDDRLIGGLGADRLIGGTGADTFVYKTLADSLPTAFDTITDFSVAQGDLIDLLVIDARPSLFGDQAFVWIGLQAFSGRGIGQARYRQSDGDTVLEVDTGDGIADMVVLLAGLHTLTAANLLL